MDQTLLREINPVQTQPEPDLASRTRRLGGQLLDGVVAYIPIFATLAVDSSAAFMVAWGFAGLYLLLADGLPGGQSLGKRLLRMRVVEETSGRECSFGKSFLRNVLLMILGPFDWVFIFGKKHQRLGDKAAETIVVML